MLRGWFGYFKHAVAREFKLLDSFIRRRLRAILRKQEKRPRVRALSRRPSTLAKCILRESRTVHIIHSPLSSETPPMRKPTTGEPCAGELPARFGGRGGDEPSLPLSSFSRINQDMDARHKAGHDEFVEDRAHIKLAAIQCEPGVTGTLSQR